MSRIRIIRTSGLEASLSRLDGWWSALSRRERVLVGTLGAIIAALFVAFVVIKPIQGARAEAKSEIRTYETLLARMRAAGTLSVRPPSAPTGTPAQIIASAATQSGIAVTVADGSGPITASANDVAYDGVVNWLSAATSGGLSVTNARIVKANDPGRVNVTVEFGS